MNVPPAGSVPPTLWDAMLRLVPLNLLFFDAGLICRYAAPIGDHVLGRRAEELLGLPAMEILPPEPDDLGSALERAVSDATPWHNPEYRFAGTLDGSEQLFCWSIRLDPVRVGDIRGVLVAWADILAETQERDRLLVEADVYQHEAEERNAALIEAFSDLRNAITPLSGYLQLIVRRPEMLHGRAPAELIAGAVLPRIGDLLTITERLRRPPIYEPAPTSGTHRSWSSPGPDQRR
ncbi:MAG: PAS domain-containing protein [Dehalococcoidia bacterium]